MGLIRGRIDNPEMICFYLSPPDRGRVLAGGVVLSTGSRSNKTNKEKKYEGRK
jgi:hypothetical protein